MLDSVFCLLYDNIICGQFIFFYLGGQSVSYEASLAALRLYGYFLWFFYVVLLSENKFDDDDRGFLRR